MIIVLIMIIVKCFIYGGKFGGVSANLYPVKKYE